MVAYVKQIPLFVSRFLHYMRSDEGEDEEKAKRDIP
jgi:hypothetical protein